MEGTLKDGPATVTEPTERPTAQLEQAEQQEQEDLDVKTPAGGDGNKLDIGVWGIEKFFDERQCLRFFRKHFLQIGTFDFTHIGKPHNKPQFFVRFTNEKERERFLSSPISRNRKIRVRPINYDTSDTQFLTIDELSAAKPEQKRDRKVADPAALEAVRSSNIQDIVEPYHNMPYDQQIKEKQQSLEKTIENYNTQFFRDPEVKLQTNMFSKQYQPLKLTSFVPCDGKRTQYRNKTEFTIGYDGEGKVTVGFNKGSFEAATIMIEDPRRVTLCSIRTKTTAAVLEQYIRSGGIKPFDRFDQSGFWRYLVVRESERTGEVLVMIVAADKNIDAGQLTRIHGELVDLFKKSIVGLTGLCFMGYNGNSDSIPIEAPLVLWGNGFYHERILGNTFRVSSSAFLQGHTEMCEVLYSKIIELCAECDVVLDLCCGIGTIGICIKNHFKNLSALKVVGIECCAQAVQDAKANDSEYEVVLAKVEDGIKAITEKYRGQRIIGILDPPRAGVNKDVITALRRCRGLDHIVYVACSPSSVQDNLLQLTLPVTTKRKAPEFVIKQMFGLDLFPQTKHYEALYYLERT